MKLLRFFLAALLVAAPAAIAHGHGFSLSLSNNTLIGSSGAANPHLFFADLELIAGHLESDHGGPGSTLFGNGKELGFDVFTPLYYSTGDGNPAVLADPNVSLEIAGTFGTISVDASSALTPGYKITGNTSHEFTWSLLGTSIPEGVYGIGYRVRGNPVGGSAYAPTELLAVTYFTPGFFPGNDPLDPGSPLAVANAAIYAAATNPVPEPSSMVLGMLGLAALATYGSRRRHRRTAG